MMFCEGLCGTLITVVAIVILILVLHYFYLLWNSDYWKKRGIFCPDSKALFGNLPGQVTGKRNIIYDLSDLYREYKGKYPYIGIYNFRLPRLLVFNPEIIKSILVKYFKHFQGTEFYGKIDRASDPLFGKHPFFLTGEEWKTKRAEISPAFTNTRIKAIFPIGLDVTSKMINYIKQEIAKEDFDGLDAKDLAARYTISVVSNSIYNVDSGCFEGKESEVLETSQKLTAPNKRFMIISMLTTIYPFLCKYLKFSFSRPGAENYYIDLMNEAMQKREESKVQRVDYLDHLMNLKRKKEISDLDIACHAASFLADGFDTTSSAISAVLKELGDNKDVQDKLRDEINSAMPNDEDFTYDNIVNLQYLDQVWNETLRMHGPATNMTRYCTETVEIDLPKDKKLLIEKGTIVMFPIAMLHNDPEYFPNPKKFDPDRFAPENGGVKAYMERGVFMPFGDGPRICVGSRFAYAQAKIAIAALVKNFEISVNPKSPEEYIAHPQGLIYTLTGCIIDFKEIKQSQK